MGYYKSKVSTKIGAFLLADLYDIHMKPNSLRTLLSNKLKTQTASYNFTFGVIDDDHSINNGSFHLHTKYPLVLEIKDTSDTLTSTSFNISIY